MKCAKKRKVVAAPENHAGLHVRLSICFKRQSDNRPVVFKSDGQRFAQPLTVKFNQDEVYDVQLSVQPPVAVEAFLLHEEKLKLEEIRQPHVPHDLTLIYRGTWKPQSFERTKKQHREQLKITVLLKDAGTFFTTLQSKFYPLDECSHSSWGETLNLLHYDCVITAQQTITINKQHLI